MYLSEQNVIYSYTIYPVLAMSKASMPTAGRPVSRMRANKYEMPAVDRRERNIYVRGVRGGSIRGCANIWL